MTEQQWFQQIRGKWDELDAASRAMLRTAFAILAVVLVFGIAIGSLLHVRGLRRDLAEKRDLLEMIQAANEEARQLRDTAPSAAIGGQPGEQDNTPWSAYFESQVTAAGLDKSVMAVGEEKKGESGGNVASESLIDVTLKHVNIKQIVKFAYYLENGARPAKLRDLIIDTGADPAGYMDATFAVSAFKLK